MRQSGITLVELMIALTIGLFLTALLFNNYVGSQGSVILQSNIVRVEDALSNSMDLVTQEIEQAGYIGCAKLTVNFPVQNYLEYKLTSENQLILSDNFLVSRHAAYDPVFLIEENSQFKGLYATDNHLYQPGNVLIISDCKHAEIFQIKHIYHINGMQKIEPVVALHSEFSKNAEIALFEINKLFIKYDGQSVLYSEDVHHSIKPLQEGIAGLRFQSFYDKQHLKAVGFSIKYNLSSIKKEWNGYVSLL